MQIKDLESKSRIIETANGSIDADKSLKNPNKVSQRVDINVLKSRLKEKEDIILKKNILILVSCLTLIIAAGISVTYL
mgnify:CR=1 FL=1